MPLIRLMLVCQRYTIIHHATHNQNWKKNMAFTLTINFKVHLHWDQDEIMPWYYVMILGVVYSFYFGPYVNLLKDHMI